MAGRIEHALAESASVPAGFGGPMQRHHEALETGGMLSMTLAVRSRLITALYESAERSQPMTLPIGPDHSKYHGWRPVLTSG